MSTNNPTQSFAEKVLIWFDQHGRKSLPWQHNPTAYRVWVSEIMLQQTQVTTVIPYFQTFIKTFPDVLTLANADQDRVLQHWAGLGYYSRARNLHNAAQQVRDNFSGNIPDTLDKLISLSGIGRSTAGAILSLAYKQAQPILDGNVKRVLARYHAISGWTGKSSVQKQLWQLAEQHLPTTQHSRPHSALKPPHEPAECFANYTQAMMDLGATLCTRSKPDCHICPLQADCKGLKEGNPTAYPTPKPRKTLPEKQAIMLLIKNKKNQVLLQKQPPVGIWGGLWSLPQFDDLQAADTWYAQNYAKAPATKIKLTPFKHVFSHFCLHVQPFVIEPISETSLPIHSPISKGVMEADNYLWYNSETAFTGGLPAPIKKLFKRIHLCHD